MARGRPPKSEVRQNIIEVLHGKRVVELKPRGIDKGTAVRLLLRRWKKRASCALYFGDDETDEAAFRVLKGRGVTVLVAEDRSRETAAEFRVESPAQVHAVLRVLLQGFDEKRTG